MRGVYQRGNTYYIDFYDKGRRYQRAVGPNKKEAEIVLKKKQVEVREGKFLDIDRKQKVKFEELAEMYMRLHATPEIKKSWHSDEDNIKRLSKFFAGKYLHEITPLLVQQFKIERASTKLKNGKTLAQSSVNRNLACLKCMFNKAKQWGKFSGENPVKSVKLFKENNQRLRFLEREELDKLLSHCEGYLKAIVIVAVHTGMRKSEILNLKWHDIDFHRDIIYLSETKSGERREIRMNPLVKAALIKIKKHPESAYIFCNQVGKPFGDIKNGFLTALRKSDILKFHFHDLRHTFASHLVMSGVDLNTVRELLGHKTIQMTLRYSHLSQDHKKRAVDLLSARLSPQKVESSDNLVTAAVFSEVTKQESFRNSFVGNTL